VPLRAFETAEKLKARSFLARENDEQPATPARAHIPQDEVFETASTCFSGWPVRPAGIAAQLRLDAVRAKRWPGD